MQSRRHSVAESAANIAIGYVYSVAIQCLIFPLFDIHTSFGKNMEIGAAFTVLSLVRSYALRRLFTHMTERNA